jgi:predicted RNA-binding protein
MELAMMCEFKVFKGDKLVFKDAVYAKAEGGNVTVKDVLGVSETFKNCTITEVDVGSERLVLTPTKKQ